MDILYIPYLSLNRHLNLTDILDQRVFLQILPLGGKNHKNPGVEFAMFMRFNKHLAFHDYFSEFLDV